MVAVGVKLWEEPSVKELSQRKIEQLCSLQRASNLCAISSISICQFELSAVPAIITGLRMMSGLNCIFSCQISAFSISKQIWMEILPRGVSQTPREFPGLICLIMGFLLRYISVPETLWVFGTL